MSITQLMDKKNVVHIYSGVLFAIRKNAGK
jgi:hypothetical protein